MKLSEIKSVISQVLAEAKEAGLPKSGGKLVHLKKELAGLKKMQESVSQLSLNENDNDTLVAEYIHMQKYVNEYNKIKDSSAKLSEMLGNQISEVENKISAETQKIKEMMGLLEPAPKKEELKTVKEPNPNAGKYQILTHKNTPVTDKFFDTMDDATQFVRKQKYSFEIKIQKVSPERSVYKKVSENISNTAQMGGVTSSKGTAGYINNPDKKEETKALTTYKVGDQVKFTNGEVWKVTKPGVKGDKVFLAPFNDIAKKGHTSIAIEFTADELKDTLKENITSRLKPGNKYTYEGGAEEAILVYIGTSQDNPDIRVGSSMGKGHIFKWPDGKYFELGPMSVSKYISKSESSNEDEEDSKKEEIKEGILNESPMMDFLNAVKDLDPAAVSALLVSGLPIAAAIKMVVDTVKKDPKNPSKSLLNRLQDMGTKVAQNR